jgi:branched-chain amino acid transport system permease protein
VLGGFIVSGGIVFTALRNWFHLDPKYTLLIGGIGLIVTAIRNPEGIAGALRVTGQQVGRVVHRQRPLVLPEPLTPIAEG